MALDGLGLVYEKQGNTGAAAYNQPSGKDPFAVVNNTLAHEYLIKQQEKSYEDKLKAKQKTEAEEALKPKDLSGWEIQDTRELGEVGNKLKDTFIQLKVGGVDPTDYSHPDSRKYQELLSGANQLADASKFQKKEYYDVVTQLENDMGKTYDKDATMKAINANASLPISERKPFKSLIVAKEVPYDALAPLKDFTIAPYVGKFGNDTPEGGTSGSTLNKANLKADIQAKVDNPLNEEHYQKGVEKGLWNSKKEYSDYLYKNAANKYTPDFTKTVKAPKAATIVDIDNGNSEELITSLGTGKQVMTVPVFDVNNKSMKGTAQSTIGNVVQLDNINSTVNWATAINPKTGERKTDPGTFNLVSGAMALPLVRKGSDRIISTDGGTFTYKDSNGKEKTITGDKATIDKELVRLGIAEYKPMIFGKAQTKVGTTIKEEDIWIPADAAALGTNDKNKPLTAAERAYKIYEKRAKDLNGSTGETEQTQESWNAEWAKLKKGQTMVGLDGNTYTKQ